MINFIFALPHQSLVMRQPESVTTTEKTYSSIINMSGGIVAQNGDGVDHPRYGIGLHDLGDCVCYHDDDDRIDIGHFCDCFDPHDDRTEDLGVAPMALGHDHDDRIPRDKEHNPLGGRAC